MPIFHLAVKIHSRSTGKSVVACMAYRAGKKLVDSASTGLVFDYTKKRDVIYTRVLAPKNSPAWINDISALANALESCGKRKDSQLAREVEIALPIELDHQAQIKLVEKFVYSQFVKLGMVAHVSLHDAKKGNPHAHILLSLNEISATGFGKKCRAWNEVALVNEVRYQWEIHCNRSLSNRGIEARINHRSLHAQGIQREPIKRISRIDYASNKKRSSTEKTFNQTKENNMTESFAVPMPSIKFDDMPLFHQPAKHRMEQLHFHLVGNPVINGIPGFFSNSAYHYWLADVFSFPAEKVQWVRTSFQNGYRIQLPKGSIIDYGDTMQCESSSAEEIDAIIKLAKAKGWSGIRLSGNESFRKQACVMAIAEGFLPSAIQGYVPTEPDLKMAQQIALKLNQMAQMNQQLVIAAAVAVAAAEQEGKEKQSTALKLKPLTPGGNKP